MRFIMTHEIFLKRINEKFGSRFIIIDTFISLKAKINVECNKCKNVFTTTPSSLLYENHIDWCSVCKQEKIHQNFIKRVKDTCGCEYIVLTKYKNCKEKVLFKHNVNSCNNEFWMTPDTFFNRGSRCPKCMHRQGADKLFLSDEEFKERVSNIHDNRIIINSKYKGYANKVKITHLDCGRTFSILAGSLLEGKGCRYCAGTMKKTQGQFEEEISKKYNGEYTILGKYINSRTKVLTRHNLCGHEWGIAPTTLLKRRTCPNCNQSQGEFEIENFCICNNINYETQYIFDECQDKDYLKFDFAIFNSSGLLKCVIEYDGIGHFEPVQFGGISLRQAQKNFKETTLRDNIKTEYCTNNHIPLLRIKYNDKDFIARLLIPFLNQLLNAQYIVPNKYEVEHLKKNNIKLLELLKKLPNGLYPKDFIRKSISKKYFVLSTILKDEVVKKYIHSSNINITKNYIEINKSNNYDFIHYYKIGINNNFDFPAFRFIKNTINLQNGNYEKGEINVAVSKYTNLNCTYMMMYMKTYGIINQQRYIKVYNFTNKEVV